GSPRSGTHRRSAAAGSIEPRPRTDRGACPDQHARRLTGVRRADALASAGQRAARHPRGAGSGELLRSVAAAFASLAALVAKKRYGRRPTLWFAVIEFFLAS